MSITFEQLLTDPKYREMSESELYDVVEELEFKYYPEDWGKGYHGAENTHKLYNILQKLKAESEKKAEPLLSAIKEHGVEAMALPNLIPNENKESAPASSETKMVGFDKSIENFWNPIHKSIKFTPTEHPIKITDQKAREIIISKELLNPNYTDQARKEIIAKLNDCNPNEIKIV